ncbi:Nucleolar complex protein 2-like protein [Bienertia sinuspersici]
MGKLGKKARKFAKKNLQSVMKKKRKFNSKIRKKDTSRVEDGPEDKAGEIMATGSQLLKMQRMLSLDIVSSDRDQDIAEDASESDGYLSEDSSCSIANGNETEASFKSELPIQNQAVLSELLEKKQRLEALKQKSGEDKTDDHDLMSVTGVIPSSNSGRLLSASTIKSWCQIVKEKKNMSVFRCLLNAYRAACHYGNESTYPNVSITSPTLQNKETFCSILMFMLSEADELFRGLLGISSHCKKETILELKSNSKWGKCEANGQIFFDEYFIPIESCKLTEVAVHLWATGVGTLSSCSFFVIRDLASALGHDSYDRCLKKAYKAIISRCRVVDSSTLKHIEYIKNSFVELCSIDLQKSVKVALASAKKLAVILQMGLQTKEEALQKICSWEYVLCIDLWVKFVSVNIKDNDLHGLLFSLIQVINGVAKLFGGQRNLPLRVKCIQWLNQLSECSEVFIPVSSLALDILESSSGQDAGKPGKGGVNLSTILQVPKYWLKSRDFHEECVSAAVELLCAHFIQWSHHISFPELATVPVIRLKQFHEKSTVESLRRPVKRLIDQVEKNMEFVQSKREDVSYSPIDQASADSFLQGEKCGENSSFIQYYKSIIQNSTSRKLSTDDQTSVLNQKKMNRGKRKLPQKMEGPNADGQEEIVKISGGQSTRKQQVLKRKKQKK